MLTILTLSNQAVGTACEPQVLFIHNPAQDQATILFLGTHLSSAPKGCILCTQSLSHKSYGETLGWPKLKTIPGLASKGMNEWE